MERLFIEATKSSPMVRFDAEAGLLEITGKSYPENASKFYAPIFSWVQEYLPHALNHRTQMELEIIYLNSSSSKIFLNLFDLLDEAAKNGASIEINWRYHEENETALECGEEFAEELESATFNLVKIPIE
jgi:hypothetical protein